MVLSCSPSQRINNRPTNNDNGIALRVITAVRQFIRNSTNTAAAITTPSSSDSLTLRMAMSMNWA